MHVQVLQVGLVGFSIVVRTESRQTLIVEIGLNWVDAADEHVETGIKFLLVYQERIIDVPLNLEFVMERTFRQFREFLDQHYALSTAAFRGLRYECLAVVLPQMQLEITEFIGQQERVGHEFVIDGEESLQPAYDDTEYVFLGEMVHQRITIEDADVVVLDHIQIVVSQRQSVPKYAPFAIASTFSITIFADHVLQGV